MNVVAIQELPADVEPRHVSSMARQLVFRVPVTGNLGSVLLAQHGLEDRLPIQPGRESSVPAFADQVVLLLADGMVVGDGTESVSRWPSSAVLAAGPPAANSPAHEVEEKRHP